MPKNVEKRRYNKMLLGCHLKYLTNKCYICDKFASRVAKDVSQNRRKNIYRNSLSVR
jgi:hypothetical protein